MSGAREVSLSNSRRHTPSPTCDPADPPTCLYVSNLHFTTDEVAIELVDPDRNDYRDPILIRYPVEATNRRPVVIWHHGGTTSENG